MTFTPRFAALLLATGIAFAPFASGRAPAAHFVSADSLDYERILPPPPAPGSIAALADSEAVLMVQATRTPDDVRWCEIVEHSQDPILQRRFTGPRYRKTSRLVAEVLSDMRQAVGRVKTMYQRPRPSVIDSAVHPCVPVPSSYSYPSGHSTTAFVLAAVLSQVDPEHRTDYYAEAHRYAWARIVSGVHYPTDDVGGRLLADAFVGLLLKNPDFRAEAEAARAEVAGVVPVK